MVISIVYWIVIVFLFHIACTISGDGITHDGIPVPVVVRVVEHVTVELKCSTAAASQETVWWMHETNENSRFYHPNLQVSRLEDAGTWECGTFNASTSAWTTIASVFIDVLYPVAYPAAYAVLPGKNISLDAYYTYLFEEEKLDIVCTAESNPPAVYHWMTDRNNKDAIVARGNTLTFQEAANVYTIGRECEAATVLSPTFASRSTVIKHKKLNIVVMVTPIIKDDELQTLNTGETLVVDCGVSYTQQFELNATWTKGLNETISRTSTLTVRDIQPEDAGDYVCTARVTLISVTGAKKNYVLTRAVSVKVADAPDIPKVLYMSDYLSNSLVVIAGEHVQLTCVYNDRTDDTRWTKPLDPTFVHRAPLLEFFSITSSQSSLYDCTVFENGNSTGKRKSIDIQVQSPPSVEPLLEGVAYEGETFSRNCLADVQPEPSYWWLKEGDEEFRIDGALLFLPSVTLQDSDIYICYAENVIRKTFSTTNTKHTDSKRMALRVLKRPNRPLIYRSNNDTNLNGPVHVQLGELLDLTCHYTGFPQVAYRWKRNLQTDWTSEGKHLFFSQVKSQDGDTYHCEAYDPININGIQGQSVSHEILVIVYECVVVSFMGTISVQKGSTLEFDCKISTANPLPFSFLWTRSKDSWNDNYRRLVVTNIQVSDVYTCLAINQYKTDLDTNVRNCDSRDRLFVEVIDKEISTKNGSDMPPLKTVSEHSSRTDLIVGLAAGWSVAVLLGIITAIVCLRRYKKKKAQKTGYDQPYAVSRDPWFQDMNSASSRDSRSTETTGYIEATFGSTGYIHPSEDSANN